MDDLQRERKRERQRWHNKRYHERRKDDPVYRAKQAAKSRAWYARNQSRAKCRNRAAYQADRENRTVCQRQRDANDKAQCLAHYGAHCALCPVDDVRALTLDHIAQDGAAERKRCATHTWSIARREGFPARFRVLCFTCNRLAWLEHRRTTQNPSKRHTQIRQAARNGKAKALSAYGGEKCACCPESRLDALTIDHVEGGGNQWRMSPQGEGTIYWFLIRNTFPTGYRVLCWNCNRIAYLDLKDRTNPPSPDINREAA
jgi:hypothetical protein